MILIEIIETIIAYFFLYNPPKKLCYPTNFHPNKKLGGFHNFLVDFIKDPESQYRVNYRSHLIIMKSY